MSDEQEKTPLERAIEHFGSAREMAKKLEVTPMSISHWRVRGVPVTRAIEIEGLTGISAESLCPEFFEKVIKQAS